MGKDSLYHLELLSSYLDIDEDTGCWNWTGALTTAGYGTYKWNGKQTSAHRIIYKLIHKNVPYDFPLDHLCRNRACSNPKHLEPVSIRTNILRGVGVAAKNARKTHCKNGHEFTSDNTYHRKRIDRPPERDCKTCRSAANKRFNEKERVVVSVN